MGGAKKVAGLSVGLVALVGVGVGLGRVTDLHAGSADDWRSNVSTKLLSLYDTRSAAGTVTAHNHENEPDSNATALDPRFNEQGWVQADVHYDCSHDTPAKALATAGLSVSLSIS
jgi:hypothetical protein